MVNTTVAVFADELAWTAAQLPPLAVVAHVMVMPGPLLISTVTAVLVAYLVFLTARSRRVRTVAVVLCSLTLLTDQKLFFHLGVLATFAGVLLAVYGYPLFSNHACS